MDFDTFQQLAAHIAGSQVAAEQATPKAPFDVNNGVKVLEWRVREPKKPSSHYQFIGTIVEYLGRKYKINNPAPTSCIGTEIGGLEKKDLPVTYEDFVAAYQLAKG